MVSRVARRHKRERVFWSRLSPPDPLSSSMQMANLSPPFRRSDGMPACLKGRQHPRLDLNHFGTMSSEHFGYTVMHVTARDLTPRLSCSTVMSTEGQVGDQVALSPHRKLPVSSRGGSVAQSRTIIPAGTVESVGGK
jgi:hypothetical protein